MQLASIVALLSLVVAGTALRFASKEAEEAYYQNLNSVESFSLSQANISAYLSAGAYCHKEDYNTMVFKGPASGFKLLHTLFDSKTDVQGYIGVLDSDRSIYVVFRGSSTISNWIVNIDAVKTDYTSFPECKCQVHKGWYLAEQTVIEDVIGNVQSLMNTYPGYAVKLTGHSLGAALAQLTSMDLAKAGITSSVLNFGQPRTGDYDFAQFVSTKVASTWRVVHDMDTVPHLPPSTGMDFYHVCREEFETKGGDFVSCSTTECEDPSCSNQFDPGPYDVDEHCVYMNGMHICSCSSAVE